MYIMKYNIEPKSRKSISIMICSVLLAAVSITAYVGAVEVSTTCTDGTNNCNPGTTTVPAQTVEAGQSAPVTPTPSPTLTPEAAPVTTDPAAPAKPAPGCYE